MSTLYELWLACAAAFVLMLLFFWKLHQASVKRKNNFFKNAMLQKHVYSMGILSISVPLILMYKTTPSKSEVEFIIPLIVIGVLQAAVFIFFDYKTKQALVK